MFFIEWGVVILEIFITDYRKWPVVMRLDTMVGFEKGFFGCKLSFEIGDDYFVFDENFVAPLNKLVLFHEPGLCINVFGNWSSGIYSLSEGARSVFGVLLGGIRLPMDFGQMSNGNPEFLDLIFKGIVLFGIFLVDGLSNIGKEFVFAD